MPLRLEALESRVAPAIVQWDGGGGDLNWSNPFNWDPDMLPGPGDDAEIDANFAFDTITHGAGATEIRSLATAATVLIQGGTFRVTGSNPSVTLDGPLTVAGGTLSLGHGTTVNGPAELEVQSAILETALSGLGNASVTINSPFSLQAGSTFRIATASVRVASAGGLTNHGTIELTNTGGQSWIEVTGGPLINEASGTIVSASGSGDPHVLFAELDNRGLVESKHRLEVIGTGAGHVNSGTLRAATADLTFKGSLLYSAGKIEVNPGRTLKLEQGLYVTAAGTLTMTGATLNLAGGTSEVQLPVVGAALVASSANVSLAKAPDVATLNASSAIITIAEPFNVTKSVSLNATNLTVGGPLAVAASGELSTRSSTINAAVTVAGKWTHTFGGIVNGSLTVASTGTLSLGEGAYFQVFDPSGVVNHGLIEIPRAGVVLEVRAAPGGAIAPLVNEPTGTVRASFELPGAGGSKVYAAVANHGLIAVSHAVEFIGDAGSHHANVTKGKVRVENGELSFSGTVLKSDGEISVAAGQKLTVAGLETKSGKLNLAGAHLSLGNVASSIGLPIRAESLSMSGSAQVTLTQAPAVRSLSLNGSALVINGQYDAGSATVSLFNGTLTTGGLVLPPQAELKTQSMKINGPVTLQGRWNNAGAELKGPLTIAAGGHLLVRFSGLYVRDPAGVTNAGTIEFNDSVYSSTLTVYDDVTPYSSGPLTNEPTGEIASAVVNSAGAHAVSAVLVNRGVIDVHASCSFTDVAVDGQGAMAVAEGVDAYVRNLRGTTTNEDHFKVRGNTVVLGSPDANDPVRLEAMSRDFGPNDIAYDRNFNYGTLTVSGAFLGGYAKLVDEADNFPGLGAEAVYVDTLVVLPNAKLDLNGKKLYARAANIQGKVTGGAVEIISGTVFLPLNQVTSGTIETEGVPDDYDFFGSPGQTVNVIVNPAGVNFGNPLQQAYVQVIRDTPGGPVVMAEGKSTANGDIVRLLGIPLPELDTYHVRVANTGNPTTIGWYTVAVYDATVRPRQLRLNERSRGIIAAPFAEDIWTFRGAAGQQVLLDFIDSTSAAVKFQLTGPGGFVGFSGLTGDSGLVNLPTTGTYTLTASTVGQGTGSYYFKLVETSETVLTVGTPYSGGFDGERVPRLFRFDVAQGQPLRFDFDDAGDSTIAEVYLRLGQPPTRQEHDQRFETAGPRVTLTAPFAPPGTWWALVYPLVVFSPNSFTVRADSESLFVDGTSVQAVAGSTAAVPLTGAGFAVGTVVELMQAATPVAAGAVSVNAFDRLTATFNLAAITAGMYDIRVTLPGGVSRTLPAAFTVVASGQPNLETKLVLPSAFGLHSPATIFIEYANTGTAPMPAPVLILQSADLNDSDKPLLTLDRASQIDYFWGDFVPPAHSHRVLIYADGGTPGVLQPGDRREVPVYFSGLLQPWDFSDNSVELEVRVHQAGDTSPIDWAGLQASLRPEWIDPAVWPVVYANLQAQVGPTWGDYVAMLGRNAAYLARVGERVTDASELYDFELRKAVGLDPVGTLAAATDAAMPTPGLPLSFERSFGNTITERHRTGPFGRGWTASWQVSLEQLGDGTAIVHESADSQRWFRPDSRRAGAYLSATGDTGVLKKLTDNSFELREVSGLKTRYHSDGRLNDVRDVNGNTITAAYNAGRLTGLAHSSGASLAITYNLAGLIDTITDSAGRVTSYAYDPTNTYLVSVTSPAGTTGYTYSMGQGAAREHALLSITGIDGVTRHFDYDARGRLAATYLNAYAERIDIAYGTGGQVTSTDAAGVANTVFYDHRGLVVRREGGAGVYVNYTYNDALQLVRTTDSTGRTTSFTRCACGRPKTITDPYGRTVAEFTLGGPNNAPTAFRDANGNVTRYGYDSVGNRIATSYADGTIERATYDPAGNLDVTTNRRGQTIDRTVNAAGQVTHETRSDGTTVAYAYDSRGRLHTVTDAAGTTTLEYYLTDELKKVTYPNGRWVEYFYAGGRRTGLADHSGFGISYEYDPATGRLWRLRDNFGDVLAQYTYEFGRLTREDKGNGTYTTYGYDALGRLTSITHHAPGGAVNSQFVYTYDAAGRRATAATSDGTWTYTYDLNDQLARAVFASTNPAIPNQDLNYEYDAVGNRVRTVLNGVTTAYTVNNMNQYTSVGEVSLQYDADGNLTAELSSGVVRRYSYDILSRLTRAETDQGTWQYEYSALGARSAVVKDGTRTEHLVDPTGLGDVIGDYDAAGLRVRDYAHGLGLEAVSGAAGWSYFDFDGVGSTAGLTGTSGQYTHRYVYEPFGTTLWSTGAATNAFTFVGQFGVMSDGNGLSYMRARFQSGRLGRFLSPDPIGLAGGDAGLYSYASQNPLSYVDPEGLCATDADIARLEDEVAKFTELVDYRSEMFETHTRRAARERENAAKALLRNRVKLAQWHIDNAELQQAKADAARDELKATKDELEKSRLALEAANNDRCKPLPPPPPAPKPPSDGGTKGGSGTKGAVDPNEKDAAAGFGPERFIDPDTGTPYRVKFENLGPGSVPTPARPASAPAQRVEITDQLSADLDWASLAFTEFGFGDTVLAVPAGRQYIFETVPVTINGQFFEVEVELDFDAVTGLVRAVFQSIEPGTSLPPGVLTGFLPPEDGTGVGQGYFGFRIVPDVGLPTGRQLRNVALISFDGQPVIATNQVDPQDPGAGTDPNREALNTIDAAPPTSAVTALPAFTNSLSFPVSWSGADDAGGSGIASFNVYVSDNGGTFALWQSATTATAANFTGQNGHTYSFYSTAVDNVGLRQPTPGAGQATTAVQVPPPTVTSVKVNGAGAQRSMVTSLVVTFSEAVSFTGGAAGAFQLNRTGPGGTTGSVNLNAVQAGNAVTITFAAGGAVNIDKGGSLLDGTYQLTVLASKAQGAGGSLDGDGNGTGGDNFQTPAAGPGRLHRLFGDNDGDGDVDVQDYGAFRGAFGSSSFAFDNDGDGDVDTQDFGQFRQRFGTSV